MSNGSRDIATRAGESSSATPGQTTCRVPGCGRLTQRASRRGLSELYCKRHIEFHRRHGSYWKRSLTATEIRPYRQAAREWLRKHRKDGFTRAVVAQLDRLLANSGEPTSAYDLRGMPATEKAKAVFARLRAKRVPGFRLLEVALAIATQINEAGFTDPEFLHCQISKCAFRSAGGTHFTTSGYRLPSKYPHSAGRVLRVFGGQVWDIAALVVTPFVLDEVSVLARPFVAVADSKRHERTRREELVASEIMRVQHAGMGPQRLRQYRAQLRRQHGLRGA